MAKNSENKSNALLPETGAEASLAAAPPRLPKQGVGGTWANAAAPGNCMWNFTMNFVPNAYNPNGLNWSTILTHWGMGGLTGIQFNNGSPDFTPFQCTMTFAGYAPYAGAYSFTAANPMTAKRPTNMKFGDQDIAAHFGIPQWNATWSRSQTGLTWHEKEDQIGMLLVPTIIHGNIAHVGGVSAVKHGGIGAELCKAWPFSLRAMLHIHKGLRELNVEFYPCEDGTVHQDQWEALRQFNDVTGDSLWPCIMSGLTQYIADYAGRCEPDLTPLPSADELEFTDVLVYPAYSGESPRIALLFDFPADESHGLGVLVGGQGTDQVFAIGEDSFVL